MLDYARPCGGAGLSNSRQAVLAENDIPERFLTVLGSRMKRYACFVLAYFARRLSPDECAVVLRMRKPPLLVRGPGWVRRFSRWQRVVVVDLRPFVLTTPEESVLTADGVALAVASRIEGQISNPVDAVVKVVDYREAARALTRTAIRAVLKDWTLRELRAAPSRFNADVQAVVSEATEDWGASISSISVTVTEVVAEPRRV
jgi:regulator of protease activity HflC (stomatin/prohibitin superfamily)